MKILKHAAQYHPQPVKGPLLGLDTNKVLSISHSFPLASENSEGYRFRPDQRYIDSLIDQLQNTGDAAQFVGWYQSATSSNFYNHQVIDSLLQSQLNSNANSILLVHDASKAKKGILSLRAFRLHENFIKAYIDNNNSTRLNRKDLEEHQINYKNALVELPVNVHNSQLVSLYLHDLKHQISDYQLSDLDTNNLIDYNPDEEAKAQKQNKDNLFAATNSLNLTGFGESTALINKLVESIDDYNYDLNNFNYFQRSYTKEMAKIQQWKQKAKVDERDVDLEEGWKSLYKLPNEPNRYENLLISASINGFCDDLQLGGVGELVKSFTIKNGLNN